MSGFSHTRKEVKRMDEGYDGYRMMLREMFPEHDTKRVFVVNGSPGSFLAHVLYCVFFRCDPIQIYANCTYLHTNRAA